ncbi:helix-turn-helix transcriptional regulator [Vibrio aestuarianus]|uniref:helix-turn-helix domain-containing protein n=1 Tax=Vibrio aestuarianus TaxID=28171 RepID=UPI001559E204|nr:AraC family transcriptional regulator [Vibrio aestuarianus]NGZ13922.1 helix-turn-helix transcriptional regulator [Vibrio aestuarianus]NKZ50070.1 helix-turn-helix transcriptional regulator [Vibrio aestuarianus]
MKSLNSFCRIAETEYALSTDKVNILYYDLPKHFHDEYRSYDAPRLCTILQGHKEVVINQAEQFSYQREQCVLLPPHSTVYMSMTEYTKALVYEFSDEIVDGVRSQVSEQLEVDCEVKFDHNQFQLEQLQDQLLNTHVRVQSILQSRDNNITFLLDLTCQELVYELLKRQGCHDILHHYKNHPINRVISLMKSNQGQVMSISDFAEEVNMSLPNFSQKFKMITTQSPKEFMTKVRLTKAKRYLSSMSVTDTALELGYENISHFIRLFKKEFGITPKQFKLTQELSCR